MAHHHHHHRKPAVSPELALASDLFDKFCGAATLKTILSNYRSLCEILHIKPTNFPQFYPKLKSKLCSWRAQALWNKFDKRANHKCYNRGKACPNTRVLIIGAGPCGLRAAIEAQLLGAKVVVIEKRDRISRNNVLHLWPFVIQDLRSLGAKKFFGKFCAGSIDHISIRQLQCILLKVALLLGVEIHEGISFEGLVPPPANQDEERIGWRAKITPEDHPVSQYEFDVLIGADGKRNTLEGFKRKEFRGKLAIAITANFINHHSEAEARVEEISGVAYIFNQKFFKDLRSATGIDLENIVYYKDDTHYFVMTAKKHSLINKGVISNDFADTAKLLAIENINKDALMEYAREAADFSTGYKLPQLQFAVNHYGQPDVAMFDFTSMYAAENASRVIQERGYKLLMCLVGDSLLEPFWPTGSGCARGFLSSMDACWVIRSWGSSSVVNPLEVLAERESIYRLLNQTTPENLSRDIANYMLDPHTRYPNLNTKSVLPIQVKGLYSSDDPATVEHCLKTPSSSVCDYSKKRRRKDTQIHHDVLLSWLKRQVALYNNIHIEDTSKSFKDGLALCAIIHRYRPDLIDFYALESADVSGNNQQAFDILEKEYGILPVMTGIEMEKCDVPDTLTMLSYLTQVYDIFRGEIPYTHHKKMLHEHETEVERILQILNHWLNLEPKSAQIIPHYIIQTDDDDVLSVEPSAVISQATVYKNSLGKMTQSQKLSLLSRLSSSIPRKRYRESRSPTVTSRSIDVPVPRKPKKRKSGSSTGFIANRKNCFERSKKKSIDKSDDPAFKKEQQKLIAARIMKSVRMLQDNSKHESDNTPFEDYSMFLYRQVAPEFKERVKDLEKKLLYPDRDPKELHEFKKNPMEVNFSGRVKDIETKLKEGNKLEKKPKDLLRAIGKIEKTDWNIKEIEKKIEENKYGRGVPSSAAKVPKWNRQQFDDKFTAVKKKLIDRDAPSENKYAAVDNTLKRLEQKLKNGTALEQGQRGANKVSAMAAQLTTLNQLPEEKLSVAKSGSKNAVVISNQGGSEICHFCNKRVYLMERLNAEGRFFHRGCFRCEYCGISLRLGNYSFDRDGKYGSRFYCAQHFGYPGVHRTKVRTRYNDYKNEMNVDGVKSTDGLPKTPTSLNMKFLNDSTDTPERVGFENLEIDKEDTGNISINEMDEDEWTDHNFGTSANELASSDDVSDISESEEEEDNEDEFAQALDIPSLDNNESLEFTRRFSTTSLPSPRMEKVHRKSSHSLILNEDGCKLNSNGNNNDSDSTCSEEESPHHISYHEFESEDESDTATGDKVSKSKDPRLKEVHLRIPDRQPATDSGSETEVASDEYSMSSGNSDEYEDEDNDDDDDDNDSSDSDSATEISTDSEFERNHATVIKSEIPDIVISESLPTRRGHLEEIKTIQVVSRTVPEKSIVRLKDAVPETAPSLKLADNDAKTAHRLPFVNPHRGDYYLNRTQSTEGVASKISLELKKKYLFGDTSGNAVKKSGSTSVLDTKFKSLVDQISEHQKLLNPATPEPSQTMQAFLESTGQLRNTIASPVASLRKSKELLAGIDDVPHVCSQSNNLDSVNVTAAAVETNRSCISSASQAETDTSPTTTTSKTVVERPPSPIYETSIVVPELPKPDKTEPTTGADVTSASDASSADEFDEEEDHSYHDLANAAQISLPKVEIHNSRGELLPQDVEVEDRNGSSAAGGHSKSHHQFVAPIPDVCMHTGHVDEEKRNGRESSSLSKIMAMPVSDQHCRDRDAQILRHVSTPAELFISSEPKPSDGPGGGTFSDKSSPSTPTSLQGDDNTLAVFTETELSDWARDEDGAVSENFDDLVMATPNITYRRHQKPKKRASARNGVGAKVDDLREEYVHVCGKTEKLKPPAFVLANIDDMDIEFMDTGEDDDAGAETAETVNPAFVKNSGYIEYVTSEDEAKTPLAEAVNANFSPFAEYAMAARHETPTNAPSRRNGHVAVNANRNGEAVVSARAVKPSTDDFDQFVHRLQDRITPFGNVKDSIDIRKSRKSTKSPPTTVPIAESPPPAGDMTPVDAIGGVQNPSQKLEQLSRERCKQKNLIHEMVMSKLQSEGKQSIQERKAKRQSARNSLSPFSSSSQNSLQSQFSDEAKKDELLKYEEAACDLSIDNKENIREPRRLFDAECIYAVTTAPEPSKSKAAALMPSSSTSLFPVAAVEAKYAESFSLPDIRKALLSDADDQSLTAAVTTPSTAKLEILKSTESIRQQARTRARLMSDSELGLSPEDKLKLLKQKIAARKAVQSAYVDYPREDYMNDSNSVLDVLNNAICEADWKSSLDETTLSPRSKSAKDKDRRKSIIQAVSDFFLKKSPTKSLSPKDSNASASNSKLKFKLLMGKEKAKSADDVFALFMEQYDSKNQPDDATLQPNYISENDLKRKGVESSVPPRPPSPTSYTPSLDKSDENLSITTIESRDENSTLSTSKQLRSSHRKTKRENQKRLRMAQEIQRQLEEIEVKQKELEFKGVNVEKALRNKNQDSESEFELMQELLDMIRERNELRKYEQKLLLKAKEIEAEDPYLN